MRNGEVEGKDHTFISNELFHQMYSNNQIAASTYFNSNYYGASKRDVLNYDIYVIDKAGLIELKKTMEGRVNIVSIYIEAPTLQLIKRMRKRGDTWLKITSRIINDFKMFKGTEKLCGYCLPNNYLVDTVRKIESIIQAGEGV